MSATRDATRGWAWITMLGLAASLLAVTASPAAAAMVSGNVTVADNSLELGESTQVTVTVAGEVENEARPMDVAIVLDESASMDATEFDQQRQFAIDVATDLGGAGLFANGGSMAVVGYSHAARVVLEPARSLNEVTDALSAMVQDAGVTCITCGVNTAREQVTGPNATTDARKVMIVLTDGVDSGTDSAFSQAVSQAQAAGIERFAVSIGGQTNPTELAQLASDPDSTHLFNASDFAALSTVVTGLASEVLTAAATNAQLAITPTTAFNASAPIASNGTATVTGGTLNWSIPLLEDEPATLTYTLTHNGSLHCATLPVHASISYSDNQGGTLSFPNPTVEITGCAVLTGDVTVADASLAVGGSTEVTVEVTGTPVSQTRPMDTAIVLDESSSMDATEYDLQREFARDVASDLAAAGLFATGGSISIVGYAHDARVVLEPVRSLPEVLDALDGMVQRLGVTCITCGVNEARAQLTGTNATTGARKVMVVTTDGVDSGTDGAFSQAVSQAQAAGIERFAVSIGGQTNRTELAQLASDPDSTHLFNATDFTGLSAVVTGLAGEVVSAPAVSAQLAISPTVTFTASAPTASNGTATVTDGTIDWSIPELDEQPATLTYTLTHDGSLTCETLPVHASLTYSDNQGGSLTLSNPTVEVTGCPAGIQLSDDAQALTGQPGNVEATVIDAQGSPVASADVTFTVTDGPSQGQTATVTTDDVGVAMFTYTSDEVGVDTVSATVDDITETVTIEWLPPNSPPTVDAGADQTVTEGDTVALTAVVTDPDGDPTTGTWTPAGLLDGDNLASTTWVATDDGSQEFTFTASDESGAADADSTTITVVNAAPMLGILTGPESAVEVGTAVMVGGDYIDPGSADTHEVRFDWGDGTVTAANAVTGGSFDRTHTYAEAGVYEVAVTVTDDDGGVDQATYAYVVVYDPSAGFVTGGGTIDVAAGSQPSAPDASGVANFGFVSKYHKGAKVPTGATNFRFKAGNFDFQSNAYDWLVIAGTRAQYKGTGTVNGEGSYGFLLTAVDGNAKNSTGNDTLRLKVWDLESDGVMFDNQRGADDNADPATAIRSGSIVVHRK